MSHIEEAKILSAENLRIDGKPMKKNAHVVLQLDSKYSASMKAHNEGGSNPTWNHPLTINMPLDTRVITLQVKCKTGSHDKLVGTIRIPVSDFIGDYTPENYLHFLSYRLWDSRGERNGIINVSVKVEAPPCSRAFVEAEYLEWSCSTTYAFFFTGFPSMLRFSADNIFTSLYETWLISQR